MRRLIGGRPADGLVQHELTVGDEIRRLGATEPASNRCKRLGPRQRSS